MPTTTLPVACPKISARASPTNFSGGLTPSRSTFVESEKSAVTPSAAEIARSRSTPVGTPSSGYGSILKSPVWTKIPSGQRSTYPTASGMLWQTGNASTSKFPMRNRASRAIGKSLADASSPCSARRWRSRPSVRRVP